jgi:hypothetical protein
MRLPDRKPFRVPLQAVCLLAFGVLGLWAVAHDDPGGAALFAAAPIIAFGRGDKALSVSQALPNGAATTLSEGIDLGGGARLTECELRIEAPALTTAELANAATVTYTLEFDDDPAFGTAVAAGTPLVQTGAGGVGAAAANARYRPPTLSKRYVRLKAVNSGVGDASGKSATLRVVM